MRTESFSERELATLCAAKDKKAQGELYDRYAGRLFTLCFRYVGDREEAQDLMHDSMIKAMDSMGAFRYNGEGSLYAWLQRLTVNVTIDRLREMSKLRMVSLEDAVDSIPAQVMLDMIAALPDVRRTVFNMYCIDGYSHKDIAAAIGITEKGSASILAKARAQLRNAINDYLKRTGQ